MGRGKTRQGWPEEPVNSVAPNHRMLGKGVTLDPGQASVPRSSVPCAVKRQPGPSISVLIISAGGNEGGLGALGQRASSPTCEA